VLGCRVKSGWTVVVLIDGSVRSPALEKVVVGFQGLRLKPLGNRLACLVVARGSPTDYSKVGRYLISVSRRGERARVLHIKGAQRRLDAVAEAGDALFDGWAQ
jgi:hypothetical protein